MNYLVSRWYKDYKGYAGVNRARTRNEEAAQLLKAEGCTTDPNYTSRLIQANGRYARVQVGSTSKSDSLLIGIGGYVRHLLPSRQSG